MRAVLKGKTQEFIQGGITPSGLATQVRRGVIKGFDPTTYRATVQLLGSLSVWLEGVPVAHYLRPNLLTSGARCGVTFFDESNPSDACLAFTYDNIPPSGDLPLLQGAPRNVYIQQRANNAQGDNLSLHAGDAGTGGGAYRGGHLYLYGGAGVSGGSPGDMALAYTGSGVRGSVGIGGLPPAGQTGRLYTYGQIYPGPGSGIQSTRYLYDAGATSGIAIAGGPFSTTGRIYPGTGSALQTAGYITADGNGRMQIVSPNLSFCNSGIPIVGRGLYYEDDPGLEGNSSYAAVIRLPRAAQAGGVFQALNLRVLITSGTQPEVVTLSIVPPWTGGGSGLTNHTYLNLGGSLPLGASYGIYHASGANLTTGGVWTDACLGANKKEVAPLQSPDEALQIIRRTIIYTYERDGEPNHRRIGLIAEDAPEVFVSPDRTGIAAGHVVGVLLAAVQALDRRLSAVEKAA